MEKINDIEPIIPSQIEHYTTLYIVIFALTIFFGIFLLWRFWKKRRVQKVHPFDRLDYSTIDKEFLYNFTLLAKRLPHKEGLDELLSKLEPYKYKRESEAIDPAVIEAVKEYIKRCRQ